jgi:N-acetylglucosaminyldiphosphoundecaprenol N-acetyl-beta-D-mannosaminyltransferase
MSLKISTMSSLPESMSLLGVRVDCVTQQQAIERIDQLVSQYKHSAEPLPCQQVVTVNTEFVMMAQQNTIFRNVINSAALVVADGAGIVWATRYLGKPTPERVTGTDTLVELAQLSATRGYRLYLLGAAPGVAEEAAHRLQHLAPGLHIAGTYAGSPASVEEDAIIERVREAQADILCVAYGAPAQELWIARNLARLPVAVAMGVGGAYDFLSGRQLRAPLQMQKMSLEWLYRLYREPWRLRRMLAIPRFMLKVVLKGRKGQELL